MNNNATISATTVRELSMLLNKSGAGIKEGTQAKPAEKKGRTHYS